MESGEVESLLASMREAGVDQCVVNSTCEADWSRLLEVSKVDSSMLRPAIGIHPWWAGKASVGWVERMGHLLDGHPNALIGECGLDAVIRDCPLDVQWAVFLPQLEMACRMKRPVVIHCVRAWGRLMDGLEHYPAHGALMHAFSGSLETACRLLRLGAYFSFSPIHLKKSMSAASQVFRELPRDRILIETDASGMQLPDLAGSLAEILAIPVQEVASITHDNAVRWLSYQ
jgi:TatD DNase family protein